MLPHATVLVQILDVTRFPDANRFPLRSKTLWKLKWGIENRRAARQRRADPGSSHRDVSRHRDVSAAYWLGSANTVSVPPSDV
jgi:hypothetical protein